MPNQTTPVCSGATFNVAPANNPPTTIIPTGVIYNWTSAPTVTGGITGGSAQTNQNSISQTLTNPTNATNTATYTVTPTNGCTGQTFTVIVTSLFPVAP